MDKKSVTQPCVSVIIPVYNKEPYIDELLHCMRKQTLQNMEFLYIDDKGQDNTFSHILEEAKRDDRIVCIDNGINRGPGYSRNVGIKAARGEFIAFADADDIIAENFYELLYKKAKETGALVVKGRCIRLHEDGSKKIAPLDKHIMQNINSVTTMLNLFFYEHVTAIYSSALVRKTGAINAPDSSQGEDTSFQMMVTHRLKPSEFAMEENALYIYRQVNTSLMHWGKGGKYMEQIKRSTLFKLDYMLPRLELPEDADFIAFTFERRMGELDACEEGGAAWDDMVTYINALAERLRQWEKVGGELYRPGPYAKELVRYHFDGEVYCRLRRIHRLEQSIKMLNKINRIAFRYGKLRRRYVRLRLMALITFGKARKRYKTKRDKLKQVLRQFRAYMNKEPMH